MIQVFMSNKLWLLKDVSTLLGIEWFLEKCGSQKFLAPAWNRTSDFIGLEILLLGNVVSQSLKYFLSLVLKFWNRALAGTQSLKFTILYPYFDDFNFQMV